MGVMVEVVDEVVEEGMRVSEGGREVCLRLLTPGVSVLLHLEAKNFCGKELGFKL